MCAELGPQGRSGQTAANGRRQPAPEGVGLSCVVDRARQDHESQWKDVSRANSRNGSLDTETEMHFASDDDIVAGTTAAARSLRATFSRKPVQRIRAEHVVSRPPARFRLAGRALGFRYWQWLTRDGSKESSRSIFSCDSALPADTCPWRAMRDPGACVGMPTVAPYA
jgi:hypothetical protein